MKANPWPQKRLHLAVLLALLVEIALFYWLTVSLK
jgi:hypothetical protein